MKIHTKDTCTICCTDVYSTQDWTTDPGMIALYVPRSFLAKGHACLAFMKEHDDVAEIAISWPFGFDLFQDAEDSDPGDDALQGVTPTTFEGREYFPFVPEYALNYMSATVNRHGEVEAVFSFKHTGDELWCSLGMLDEIERAFMVAEETA